MLSRLLRNTLSSKSRSFSTQYPHIHYHNYGSVKVIFVSPDGKETECQGELGQDLMRLAHANDVDLEGACEGACACSTCHVILDPEVYARLPPPSVEEEDMLDLAFGLTRTSRLGCQVRLRRDLEGMRAWLPAATRNMAVDGFKPKPH